MKASAHGRRVLTGAAAALLLLGGCAGNTMPEGSSPAASTASTALPAPAAESAAPAAPPTATAAPSAAQPAAAAPVSLSIPAIGTNSQLLPLGLRDDGTLEVPPEPPGSPAGWYTGSPAPGDRGPAVLLGHVNATGGGPGVFAGLRDLRPGDRINVAREDGSTAVFTVDRGEQYGKADFPTLEVYGNTEAAELRLITCDGFDAASGEFDDNYVVYATLVP
ncbi:class F sortase [Arthrobacter sp. zg-Y20]|uniref:class F sortase n=1 Tax=unclassified Arthrobacter TaxID=235627 RepID=UPI001D15190E|nr:MULTISPECIES: class F sortase [unclassified Arthrobacter]MCC3276514.1 class F sortase [Arthrobacter sp. zg-Y20]MDK1316674.1 class F sortase [Arthrobacter sp. zg.Y20]WIB06903.1 class F sortase [Arthrobacter sp. zg-Y20]